MAVTAISAQADTIPPYKKTTNFPAVRLLLPDSVSYYTKSNLDKKSAVMLMLFNPQCEHCQHETEVLVKNIDRFKKIEILMVTSMPFDSMTNFIAKYNLAKYKNIVVARDENYTLISFFRIRFLPAIALYNKNKEFQTLFEGSMNIDEALKLLQ
jgi:hypothetical protein